MTTTWDPTIYGQFLALRTRPARDLLAGISDSFQPKTVCDLGCGPGNSTALLKARWPCAKITGIDSSPEMLAEAKKDCLGVDFVNENIADFSPKEKIDCLFANASLQWVNEHDILIPRLLGFIKPSGVFGFQLPNNFHMPSHQVTISLLKNNPEWHVLLKNLFYGELTKPLYHIGRYYDLLVKSGAHSLQLWETDYIQELDSHQDVFEWVKGTGLRPVLSGMNVENQEKFKNAYINAIFEEYPVQSNNKVLLSYKRLFIVANCHGPQSEHKSGPN